MFNFAKREVNIGDRFNYAGSIWSFTGWKSHKEPIYDPKYGSVYADPLLTLVGTKRSTLILPAYWDQVTAFSFHSVLDDHDTQQYLSAETGLTATDRKKIMEALKKKEKAERKAGRLQGAYGFLTEDIDSAVDAYLSRKDAASDSAQALSKAAKVAQTDDKTANDLRALQGEQSTLRSIQAQRGKYGVKWAEKNTRKMATAQKAVIRDLKRRVVNDVKNASPKSFEELVGDKKEPWQAGKVLAGITEIERLLSRDSKRITELSASLKLRTGSRGIKKYQKNELARLQYNKVGYEELLRERNPEEVSWYAPSSFRIAEVERRIEAQEAAEQPVAESSHLVLDLGGREGLVSIPDPDSKAGQTIEDAAIVENIGGLQGLRATGKVFHKGRIIKKPKAKKERPSTSLGGMK